MNILKFRREPDKFIQLNLATRNLRYFIGKQPITSSFYENKFQRFGFESELRIK